MEGAVAQLLLQGPAVRDVAQGQDHAADVRVTGHVVGDHLHRDPPSVGVTEAPLGPDGVRPAAGQHAPDEGPGLADVVRMEQMGDVQRVDDGPRVPQHDLDGRRHRSPRPVRLGHHDHVGGVLDQRTEPRLPPALVEIGGEVDPFDGHYQLGGHRTQDRHDIEGQGILVRHQDAGGAPAVLRQRDGAPPVPEPGTGRGQPAEVDLGRGRPADAVLPYLESTEADRLTRDHPFDRALPLGEETDLGGTTDHGVRGHHGGGQDVLPPAGGHQPSAELPQGVLPAGQDGLGAGQSRQAGHHQQERQHRHPGDHPGVLGLAVDTRSSGPTRVAAVSASSVAPLRLRRRPVCFSVSSRMDGCRAAAPQSR